ncbi:MAG: hypothetical protein ACI91F_002830 [Candidatus Binatia bacterium]|jgi:hypothetical protein
MAASAAVWLYLPTLEAPLVFDDHALIAAQGPVALGSGVLPYRPFRHLSYLVDHRLGGGSARAYHRTNVALHAGVSVMVVVIAAELGAPAILAGAAGGIMALHPLGVEAAAYVAGRRDLLATFSLLVALVLWLRGSFWAAACCVGLAVASKESGILGIVWVGAMSLAGVAPLRIRIWQFFVGGLAAVALVVAYGGQGPWWPTGGSAGLALIGRTAGHYAAGLAGWTSRALEHPWLIEFQANAMVAAPVVWQAVGLGVFVVTGLVAGVVAVETRRNGRCSPLAAISLAIGFTVLLVAAYGGLHEPGSDRHAYPLLALVSVGIAVGLHRFCGADHVPQLVTAAAVALVVGSMLHTTIERRNDWGDPVRLWREAWRAAPSSERAALNYASVLAANGRSRAARRILERGMVLRVDDADLQYALAALHCANQRPRRARVAMDAAWRSGADPVALHDLVRLCPLLKESADAQGA